MMSLEYLLSHEIDVALPVLTRLYHAQRAAVFAFDRCFEETFALLVCVPRLQVVNNRHVVDLRWAIEHVHGARVDMVTVPVLNHQKKTVVHNVQAH